MTTYTTSIKQFEEKGDKSGWTYIELPADLAQELNPGVRKAYRVKGRIDNYKFARISLIPAGGGNYIMALNAEMRKNIAKRKGAQVKVTLVVDSSERQLPKWIEECLADEPAANRFFNELTPGHQNYFLNWLESAKSDATRVKRMTMTVNALAKKQDFGQMIRSSKQNKLE